MKTRSSCGSAFALGLSVLAAYPASAQQLREVTVSSSRFVSDAQFATAGISTLTSADILASGASNASEALVRLLGVVGRQDLLGGFGYALDLRGFGATADSNQVVILDGMRLSEIDMASPRLSAIPIESIEKIEVMRGNAAVLYGEGATAGAIVITTKAGSGASRANAASISTEVGSYNTHELRASGTLVGGGFSLDVNSSKRESDGYRDNARSVSEGSGLVAQWSNDWLRVGARYSNDRVGARFPGPLSASQYASNPKQTYYPNDYGVSESVQYGVFSQAVLGSWELVFEAGNRQKKVSSFMWSALSISDVASQQYALRATNEMQWGEYKNKLTLGVDHGHWEGQFWFGRGQQDSEAFYIRDDITLPKTQTRINLGWRTERSFKDISSSTTKGHPQAWELGVSQPWGSDFVGYARIGRSFRLANLDELTLHGSSDLKKQTSLDAELGTRWNYSLAEQAGRLEIRFYSSELKNEIGFDAAEFKNVNFDPTRRQGIEFEVQQRLGSTLGLKLIAGLREAQFTSGAYAGKEVALAPKETLSLRADWSPAAAHKVTGGLNWVSTQYADFDNTFKMPSYWVADIRYAYQLAKQTELYAGINNLFDRKYFTNAYGSNAIYPDPGRMVYAGARVRF